MAKLEEASIKSIEVEDVAEESIKGCKTISFYVLKKYADKNIAFIGSSVSIIISR